MMVPMAFSLSSSSQRDNVRRPFRHLLNRSHLASSFSPPYESVPGYRYLLLFFFSTANEPRHRPPPCSPRGGKRCARIC